MTHFFSSTGCSSYIKRPSVLFTPSCAAMTRIFVTKTLRSKPTLLSCTCLSSPSSWSRCISSMTSAVSIKSRAASMASRIFLFYLQKYWLLFLFLADSSPAWARHAHADNADPDSNSTISQSVAMAIAGSPLPHAKVNPFALPSVVSDRGRGHTAPRGPADWRVTDGSLV